MILCSFFVNIRTDEEITETRVTSNIMTRGQMSSPLGQFYNTTTQTTFHVRDRSR